MDSRQQSAHSFGDRLRREREMRGVSLDEIAQRTKIGTRLLKALEEEQFEVLPGGIFNKGFVRAYASYLGMDEEQAVAEYLQAAGQTEPDVQLIAQQSDRGERSYSETETGGARGFPFVPVLVLLVLTAAGFGGWKLYQQHVEEQEAARAAPQSVSPAASAAPAPTEPAAGQNKAPQASAAKAAPENANLTSALKPPPDNSPLPNQKLPGVSQQSAAASSSGFDVVVKTKGRAWVSLKADGKYLVRGILDAGQARTLRANQEVVVWTGNAGETEVAFQGKAVPIEGGPNEAWVLVFTPEGLKSSRQPVTIPAVKSPDQPTEQQPPPPQQLPSPQ